jgi:cyclic dehypoxanthinyl futalosine synthase
MEESVVKATGIDFGMTVEQIIFLIDETGMIPAQRNTEYKILRTFESEKSLRGPNAECYAQKKSCSRV